MPQEFEIACPSCRAVFSVPIELAGEMAECAECDTVFKIPVPPAVGDAPGLQLPKTDTGAIPGVSATPDNYGGEITHTVKLSRTSIGMIPTLRDSFKFDAPGGPQLSSRPSAAPAPPAPPTAGRKPALQRPPSAPSAPPVPPAPLPTAAASAPMPVAAPASASASATQTRGRMVNIPDWTNIKLRKEEEPLGFQETADPGVGMALLISAPALLAGIGVLFPNKAIGVAVAGIVWLVTFVAGIFILRSKGRCGLLMTNLRAIAFIGSKRLEVKK